MPSPLFNQLQQMPAGNNLMRQILDFKKGFSGNPQQMIQQMLDTGKISQSQLNQYAQQANQLYSQMKGIMR